MIGVVVEKSSLSMGTYTRPRKVFGAPGDQSKSYTPTERVLPLSPVTDDTLAVMVPGTAAPAADDSVPAAAVVVGTVLSGEPPPPHDKLASASAVIATETTIQR